MSLCTGQVLSVKGCSHNPCSHEAVSTTVKLLDYILIPGISKCSDRVKMDLKCIKCSLNKVMKQLCIRATVT